MAFKGTGSKFKVNDIFRGYINKADITNVDAGFLVRGSQNVLSTEGGRIGGRRGYELLGQANATLSPVITCYDWNTNRGQSQHLRSWGSQIDLWDSGHSRWEQLDPTVSYTSAQFNYTTFWDPNELIDVCLFVNGAQQINEWSGMTTTLDPTTSSGVAIGKQGAPTWQEVGAYTAGTRTVVITDSATNIQRAYTYTGGENTTVLTGVVQVFGPAASPATLTAGSLVHQLPRATLNSAMTNAPTNSGWTNDLIATLYNQVYLASTTSRLVYVSKFNDYTDYTANTPRQVGDGELLTLDGPIVALVPHEDSMYISAGQDFWYQTNFQQTITSVDIAGVAVNTAFETLTVKKLKTTVLEAAFQQSAITKIKNTIAFISKEPILTTLGRVNDELVEQTKNLSDPIELDFNAWDFTNASLQYFQYKLYIAIPQEDITAIYNFTTNYWEAPQILPISCYSIIDGVLVGHSNAVPESYTMFVGYSDRTVGLVNGNPISSVAAFSYQNFGSRTDLKQFNEWYTEGYMNPATNLTISIRYDYKGCELETSEVIEGTDSALFCDDPNLDNSLGKNQLGLMGLGTNNPSGLNGDDLPPKFRHIATGLNTDFYEVQVEYSSNDIDQDWELLAFGPAVQRTETDNVAIKR